MKKLNCWEFLECHQKDLCPAFKEKRLDGIHGGINSGRACWVVAGTRCSGEVQGEFAKKEGNCKECRFYKKVKEEEGMFFLNAITLLEKLK